MTKSAKVFIRLRSAFLSGLIILFTLTQPTAAQQTDKIHRVGILSNAPQTNKAIVERINQFRDELSLLGYETGRNIEFNIRYPSSMTSREVELPLLANELAALKPDVIFTFSSPASDSVHKATRTIPVVIGVSVDRFVKNISRPEGNITGLSSQGKDVIGKQLQVFREALPGMKKIGLLWEPTHQAHSAMVKEARRAAQVLGVTLVVVPAANPEAFGPAFEKMKDENVDGVVILRGGLFVNSRPTLSNLANKHRMPSMFGHPSEARAGGLMTYGTKVEALFRRAAHYVDKILKGASPSDLPVEQPTKFDLVINLKTAKKLEMSIPPTLMVQANEVIE